MLSLKATNMETPIIIKFMTNPKMEPAKGNSRRSNGKKFDALGFIN